MYNRILLEQISNGPRYVYSDVQDAVMRIEITEGEVDVFVKYRNKREFKAAYDSKLVGIALSKDPTPISKEEYENFNTTGGFTYLSLLNFAFFFTDLIPDMTVLVNLGMESI